MSRIASEAAVDVPEAFDDVASRYDLMVGLNPGYHRHLRSAAEALVERLPPSGEPVQLLDLGCGSGPRRAPWSTRWSAGGGPFG